MYRHGATCLNGPVSAARDWWLATAVDLEGPESLDLSGREIRHDLVARVRKEIAAGTYDTPDKLETALARLFMRLEC
jgi:hypothetical protein